MMRYSNECEKQYKTKQTKLRWQKQKENKQKKEGVQKEQKEKFRKLIVEEKMEIVEEKQDKEKDLVRIRMVEKNGFQMVL